MSAGEIKYAAGLGNIIVAEVRFAAGLDLAIARQANPAAVDWNQSIYAPGFDIPPGSFWFGYYTEIVALVFPNTPAQIVGTIDLTTVTFGSGGPLAGKAFGMQVDGGDSPTITFGSGGAAPANPAAVVTAINTQYGSPVASLDTGHHLVLTGTLIGPDNAYVSIFENTSPGPLEVFGIEQAVYRTNLDGLIDISSGSVEVQPNFPGYPTSMTDVIFSPAAGQLAITAGPSNIDIANLVAGHLLVRAFFILPVKL